MANENVLKIGLLSIHQYDDIVKACTAAQVFSGNTFGQVCPVIMFKQGERCCASTAFPIRIAVDMLKTDPVAAKAPIESVCRSYNRPVEMKHVKAVEQYVKSAILKCLKYILPAVTVSATSEHHIFTTKITNNTYQQVGYLVARLNDGSLKVTDGQHRLQGVRAALSTLPQEAAYELENHSLPIMLSFEDDIDQVHQDFADCSKTRPLPKSMLAVYDRRTPANGIVLKMIEQCELFRSGRTDSTSKTLSKKSNCIVLTSNVRTILKTLLTGSISMGEDSFDAFANSKIGDIELCAATQIETVELMLKYSDVLRKMVANPACVGELRQKFLIANPSGINLACKAIHRYLTRGKEGKNKELFIEMLMTQIDWKKSGQLWKGNVVIERNGGYAISSSNKPVEKAVTEIGKFLDVGLEADLERHELDLLGLGNVNDGVE